MFKRDVSFYVLDIFIAIDKIERYTSPFEDAQALLHDELSWDATIRELEIVGEATKFLLKAEMISTYYRRIVDFRNQINHAYFGVDENIVWDVVSNKLALYKSDLEEMIVSKKLDLSQTIESVRNDKFCNEHTIKVLEEVEKLR
jgi:uncharacterized protein with HEPN domain